MTRARALLTLLLAALTFVAVGQAQPQTLPEVVLGPEQAQPVRSVDCDLSATLHDVNHATVACGALYTPTSTPTPLPTATPAPTATPNPAFLATFDGDPLGPTAFTPAGWDVAIHKRDAALTQAMPTMIAGHGLDCAAPPESHTMGPVYADHVFQCRNHLMTALNAPDYGVIYLVPPAMADWSQGEAVIRWDMSTERTSSRDWIDLWVSPYDDALQLPLESWLPDLQGYPRNTVKVKMDGDRFTSLAIRNGAGSTISSSCCLTITQALATAGLTPSASRRDTFELRISRTTVKFGMPAYNRWWVNTTIADLGFDQGVVQLGHHSYTPAKDCGTANQPGPDGTCRANTWHWDNVDINPSIPFTILRMSPAWAPHDTVLQLPEPALEGDRLRFSAVGITSLSFDGGATFTVAAKQPSSTPHLEHFSNYFVPIPVGATTVQVRYAVDGWYAGARGGKDFAVWRR